MMKKVLLLALSTLLLAGSFTSCKKGENDPAVSLASRKARVSGEWTVTKEESKTTETNGGTFGFSETTVSVYDGTTKTTTISHTPNSGNDETTTDVMIYTHSLTIEKDGTYKETYANGSDIVTYEGTWMFLGKSKADKLKKKEAIMFTLRTETATSGSSTSITNIKNLSGTVLMIDQLKSKEMITIIDESYSDDNNSSTELTTTTYTAK